MKINIIMANVWLILTVILFSFEHPIGACTSLGFAILFGLVNTRNAKKLGT